MEFGGIRWHVDILLVCACQIFSHCRNDICLKASKLFFKILCCLILDVLIFSGLLFNSLQSAFAEVTRGGRMHDLNLTFTQFFPPKDTGAERAPKGAKRSLAQAPQTKMFCSDIRIAIPATVFADDECFTCADPSLFSPPRHTFIFDDDSLLGGRC